ncbi:MAG: hypothetical protein WDN06_10850 [Asticcacaulis sp.]
MRWADEARANRRRRQYERPDVVRLSSAAAAQRPLARGAQFRCKRFTAALETVIWGGCTAEDGGAVITIPALSALFFEYDPA